MTRTISITVRRNIRGCRWSGDVNGDGVGDEPDLPLFLEKVGHPGDEEEE